MQSDELPTHSDVVVIGGGIIGTSIAYYLSLAGAELTLLEKGDLASGCSGASAAWLLIHPKVPPWYIQFSRDSALEYAKLSRSLHGDIEYRQTGGMTFLFSEKAIDEAHELSLIQNRNGLQVEVLDRQATLEKEPEAGPKVLGSLYCPSDGNVNPFRTVQAFARTAQDKGARILLGTEVRSIETSKGEVAGVATDRGLIRTRKVVNAAGIAAPSVAKLAGLDPNLVPVRPVRGQVLVSERLPPVIRHTIAGFRQTQSGNILSGYMQEEVGTDNRNTFVGLNLLGAEAVDYFPVLRDVSIIRAFAGLRPVPQDGFPILDEAPGLKGFYVAAMHSGVVLAPIVGQSMTQLILNNRKINDLERFGMTRFS